MLTKLYRNREEQSAGWTSLWESNESDLWDRGRPSPAFVDFLNTNDYGKTLVNSKGQLKALVPVSLVMFGLVRLCMCQTTNRRLGLR